MSEHTPGPWLVYDLLIMSENADKTTICDVSHFGSNDNEDHANARLIATAPELLAACEALIRRYEYDHLTYPPPGEGFFIKPNPYDLDHDCPEITRARAAIAKVKDDADE